MNRTEALQALRLDSAADGRTVESAYWNLVRQAQQRAAQDREAWAEIDQLNEAYVTLAPEARRIEARPVQAAGPREGLAWLDAFADWVSAEALRTRARWPHRNPEVALIGGAGVVLMVLALGAGASVAATFIAIGLLCTAIWAPWRRV